jgi:hypothetical protein
MRVIEKLLDQVDPQTIKNYESQTQLHLKQILTTINKHKLEDITQVNVDSLISRLESISVMQTAMTTTGKIYLKISKR